MGRRSDCLFASQGTLQEVIGWGLLGWKLYANLNGPVHCKDLSGLGVAQLVCSEKGFLILSRTGAVYTQNYKSTTLVSSGAFCLSACHRAVTIHETLSAGDGKRRRR